MKHRLILLTLCVLLSASAAIAESGGCEPSIAEDLFAPAFLKAAPDRVVAPGQAGAPADGEWMAAGKGPGQSLATCEADCASGTVSCSGSTCSAWDRNCNIGERGRVSCDGTTTWCPTTCPSQGCTFQQCRQQCSQPGCFSYCVDQSTCECDVICH